MENGQILDEFRNFEESSSFVSKNFKLLQEQYPGKYIAVSDSRVLASADSFESLISEVNKVGKNLKDVIVEFIPSKGLIVLY